MHTAARLSLAVLAVIGVGGSALAASGDVPDQLQGTWAENGACGTMERTIDIIGNTLAFGAGAPVVVTYSRNDAPDGGDAIHFADEGDVSNFEYVLPDALAYHPEGYGMGSTTLYQRCDDSAAPTSKPSLGTVTRCGWYTHLNAGDYDLIDGDGKWILGANGSANVGGYDNLPYVSDAHDYVSTGGSLGYACACLDVRMNPSGAGIKTVESSRFVPIGQCTADRTLPDPATW